MEMVCPVCAAKSSDLAMAEVSCTKCGFEYAYVDCFGGKKSLTLWRNKIEKKKAQLKLNKMELFSKTDCFILSSDTVAYVSTDEKRLSIFSSDGSVEEKQNVRQYSRSERNSAILLENGEIEAYGDNSYGQCNVQVTEPAASILCAPNCIYVIGESGQISISGAVIDAEIQSWRDISALSCGSFHLLGLTKDKKVRIAGEMIEKAVIEKVSSWKKVKSICAATDCSIALFDDGTVSFAGRKNDPRSEVENWKNIISVKADSSYAVGLTQEGNIQLAGTCKAYLDMERSTAAKWKNVIAITCSRSGIAAIFNDGSLKIVGNFSGDSEEIYKNWIDHVKI